MSRIKPARAYTNVRSNTVAHVKMHIEYSPTHLENWSRLTPRTPGER